MSSNLIEEVAKAVAVAPGVVVNRKLKILIELGFSNGFTLKIKDHPANTHFEVFDGQRYEVLDRATWKWNPCSKGVKGARKVTRTFMYNDDIDSIVFENGLIILNNWIALDPTRI